MPNVHTANRRRAGGGGGTINISSSASPPNFAAACTGATSPHSKHHRSHVESSHASGQPTTIRTAAEVVSVIGFLILAPWLTTGRRNRKKMSQQGARKGQGDEKKASLLRITNNGADRGSSTESAISVDEDKANLLISNVTNLSSILVLGLVKDLNELFLKRSSSESAGILTSIEELCTLYSQTEPDSETQKHKEKGVGVWVTHAENNADDSLIDHFTKRLKSAGCIDVVFEKEEQIELDNFDKQKYLISDNDKHPEEKSESMSRYERLAWLRSAQRRRVIQKYGPKRMSAESRSTQYDVIANIDLDLLSLPRLDEFVTAAESVASDTDNSTIVCANGFETWFSSKFGPRLYYDTFASIDNDSRWWYEEYSRSLFQVLTFGQRRLFYSITNFPWPNDHSLWPMQTCFGGVAMYSWESFSSSQCDYTRSRISLAASSDNGNDNDNDNKLPRKGRESNTWQFPKEYTITGSPNGDACEHSVFQLCLTVEHEQRSGSEGAEKRHRKLVVGIQPKLFAYREANLMSTDEALGALLKGTLLLIGVSVVLAKHGVCRRKAQGKDI